MQPKLTAEERLLEILNGCEIKIDKGEYPYSVFFMKKGEIYFEIEKDIVWVSSQNVWEIFESEYQNMEYSEIQTLITDVLKKNFNIKGVSSWEIILK